VKLETGKTYRTRDGDVTGPQLLEPGWAHIKWAKEASDNDLRIEARLQIGINSQQWLRIKTVKDEMAKRGLSYTEKP